jgi:hypothetical protein
MQTLHVHDSNILLSNDSGVNFYLDSYMVVLCVTKYQYKYLS